MVQKLFLTLLCLYLTGCSSLSRQTPSQPMIQIEQSVYASLPTPIWPENTDPNIIRTHQQFLAASQAISNHDLVSAQNFLNTQTPNETETIQQEKNIISAQLLLSKDLPREALVTMRPAIYAASRLPSDTFMILEMVLMETYQRTDQPERSIATEIALNSLLNQNPLSTNIWQKLSTFSDQELNQLLKVSHSPLHRGWYSLALLSKQDTTAHMPFQHSIYQWAQQYPNHPAQSLLPSDSTWDQLNHTPPPAHVALLLPLKGDLAKVGESIHDGFMTAFYADQARRNIMVEIKVYDTTETTDIAQLYQQAVNDGAQTIVGPFAQQDIDTLNQKFNQFPVPTFILNQPSSDSKKPLLISFGLPEKNSAEQAADLAWQKGRSHLLVIAPDNPWGQTIEQAFASRWTSLGGTIVDTLGYPTDQPLSQTMATFLRIDQSQQRAQQLEEWLGEKVKNVARRRQDFDGVFLAAPPDEARQIKPLLRFYFAGNIPTFSTFSAYTGIPSPMNDKDLNGVYLNDFPWFNSDSPAINNLKKMMQNLWPTHYKSYPRLFALGMDSYWLCMEYASLTLLPQFPMHGVTGDLSLHENGYIQVQLIPYRFHAGWIQKI